MRTLGRTAAAALALTASALLAPAGVTRAGADPIGRCTTTSGTIVAVDFAHWGGPIVRGCGVNQPNGYVLLHAAGFSTAGDNHDGPGYVCRIGNQAFGAGTQYPTPAQEPCIVTPPSTAYWSYWYAPAGRNTWSYSSLGAMGALPLPGEVDLWVYGGTDLGGTTGSAVPHLSPDSVRARNATPSDGPSPGDTPTTPATGPAATAGTAPSAIGSNGSTAANGNGPNGPGSASGAPGGQPNRNPPGPIRPGTTTRHPKPSASTLPAGGRASSATIGPRFVDALPAMQTNHSAGSVVPVLIGAGLVLVLGGGAVGALWRRRQHE